ncbi:MAG: isoprenylcysteine carboxylmethyltransferase family protein [Anaerolineae bacterium]|nr:isoprenylcysteine carboxylmethyltransferase family protein [Anaerolineae bacterium]
MSSDVAHKNWWQIFEVVFGIPFLAAIGMQRILPISFPRETIGLAFTLGGTLLIIVGITFVVLARQEFARHGQPTDPGRTTREIVTMGVFSISRNPLYLGGVCTLVGISLAFNLPWVFGLLLPSVVACHYILIAPEESYLAAKFGEEYRMYTMRVHRWFGQKKRLD